MYRIFVVFYFLHFDVLMYNSYNKYIMYNYEPAMNCNARHMSQNNNGVSVKGLMSHSTHNRSFRGRFLQAR